MGFLIETHAHTAESSPCAMVRSVDLMREYKDKGYSAIVITDHVGDWGFSMMKGSWRDKTEKLYGAYEKALNVGGMCGLKVLFGIEVALRQTRKDYLIYGIGLEFLSAAEDLHKLSQKTVYEMVDAEGGLLIAAHPFRGMGEVPDPQYLHGAEIFNGNSRHNNRNHLAKSWAEENNLLQLAGSDYHELGDASAGIIADTVPKDISEFVKTLKNNEYETVTQISRKSISNRQ